MAELEVPINERVSIDSHTRTEHGLYDDEPFSVSGNAYYWYQRAVYWKRQALRAEGQQKVMDFTAKPKPKVSSLGPKTELSGYDLSQVREYVYKHHIIDAITYIRTHLNCSLYEAKNLVDEIRAAMDGEKIEGY